MHLLQIAKESAFAFHRTILEIAVVLEIPPELASELQDHYRREESGLGKLVMGRDIGLV